MKLFTIMLALCASALGDTVTAYCACKMCCGQWAGGTTAAGTVPKAGRTVAGPRSVPLGTRVHIAGVGWRVVEDRTAKRFDGRWDVYFANHGEAINFGKRKASVTKGRK